MLVGWAQPGRPVLISCTSIGSRVLAIAHYMTSRASLPIPRPHALDNLWDRTRRFNAWKCSSQKRGFRLPLIYSLRVWAQKLAIIASVHQEKYCVHDVHYIIAGSHCCTIVTQWSGAVS